MYTFFETLFLKQTNETEIQFFMYDPEGTMGGSPGDVSENPVT